MGVGQWMRVLDTVSGLIQMSGRFRRPEADLQAPPAGGGPLGQLETRLAGVVVAALKEAFDRDRARMDLERSQMEAERARAEEALRAELRRQASERALGQLRMIAVMAFALVMVSAALGVWLDFGDCGARLRVRWMAARVGLDCRRRPCDRRTGQSRSPCRQRGTVAAARRAGAHGHFTADRTVTTTSDSTHMITVYGADWCEDTRRSQRLLRRLHVPHRYVNIDDDLDGLERAKALNHGQRRTPTIDLGLGGEALVEPDNETLSAALVEREMLTLEEAHERLGIQNIGDIERVARTTLGAALLAGAAAAPRSLRWPLRLAGVFAAATGIAGWCPAYSAAGVTSLGGPGDRPDEAERVGWLAPRASVATLSDEGSDDGDEA